MLKIIFLGSGGAIPRPCRELPGVLIDVYRYRILIDPSEGTVRRLESIGVSPLKLTHIMVTHLHADHVNGLPGLLATMLMLNRVTPVTVIGPVGISDFTPTPVNSSFKINVIELKPTSEITLIESMDNLELRYVTTYHTVQNNSYLITLRRPVGTFNPGKARELGIPVTYWRRIQMGETITLPDGRVIEPSMVMSNVGDKSIKVVYTGDTSPGDNVVKLAKDSSILIHDSTYLPNDSNEAENRGHSTCLDAALDAKEAGTKLLVLTHMSFRYGYEYYWDFLKCASDVFPRTVVAKDGMIIEI
ncbi:ribonuclease Z [Caldivirga maquilingensis]|uniref:ribonuclease Z n=1 Tax=Caldivirga maquilingensis TaxID=76887 RepID=UPI0006907F4E|nr:ribonuclease Z [Caldivirga maquilingensis]